MKKKIFFENICIIREIAKLHTLRRAKEKKMRSKCGGKKPGASFSRSWWKRTSETVVRRRAAGLILGHPGQDETPNGETPGALSVCLHTDRE